MTTDSLLDYLRACREASVPGRPRNVVSLAGVRADRYAPTTGNHRLAAVTGLFAFRTMRDPAVRDPVPTGREARRVGAEERNGLLGHLATRPKHARRCGYESHVDCHERWTGARPPTCWEACGPGGTGPSPD